MADACEELVLSCGEAAEFIIGIALTDDQEWTGADFTASSNSEYSLRLGRNPEALPELVLTYADSHTGHHTERIRERGRAVHDARLGSPAMSNDLVEDQYLRGVWVHAWDQDPDDDHNQNTNRVGSETTTDGKPVR